MKILVLAISLLLVGAEFAAATSPPRPTVAQYNQDINNNGLLTTEILSTTANPNQTYPILDYTYLEYPSGLKLPHRVRARILKQHIRGVNSRKNSKEDVDTKAKTNCRLMGMNTDTPNNKDEHGHLISFKLGGPGTWFNVEPQTKRINLGTVTKTNLNAPSLWSRTEREIKDWVDKNGFVDITVVVAYDLTSRRASNRPTGFGIIEDYYDPGNPSRNWRNAGYWFSNDPNEDPDVWNSRGRA